MSNSQGNLVLVVGLIYTVTLIRALHGNSEKRGQLAAAAAVARRQESSRAIVVVFPVPNLPGMGVRVTSSVLVTVMPETGDLPPYESVDILGTTEGDSLLRSGDAK